MYTKAELQNQSGVYTQYLDSCINKIAIDNSHRGFSVCLLPPAKLVKDQHLD